MTRRRGFTAIEVLVASVIACVLIILVWQALGTGRRQAELGLSYLDRLGKVNRLLEQCKRAVRFATSITSEVPAPGEQRHVIRFVERVDSTGMTRQESTMTIEAKTVPGGMVVQVELQGRTTTYEFKDTTFAFDVSMNRATITLTPTTGKRPPTALTLFAPFLVASLPTPPFGPLGAAATAGGAAAALPGGPLSAAPVGPVPTGSSGSAGVDGSASALAQAPADQRAQAMSSSQPQGLEGRTMTAMSAQTSRTLGGGAQPASQQAEGALRSTAMQLPTKDRTYAAGEQGEAPSAGPTPAPGELLGMSGWRTPEAGIKAQPVPTVRRNDRPPALRTGVRRVDAAPPKSPPGGEAQQTGLRPDGVPPPQLDEPFPAEDGQQR